jgi:hypothetical protein
MQGGKYVLIQYSIHYEMFYDKNISFCKQGKYTHIFEDQNIGVNFPHI